MAGSPDSLNAVNLTLELMHLPYETQSLMQLTSEVKEITAFNAVFFAVVLLLLKWLIFRSV